MFSVSPAEIITIAVVALLVFGPHRLPEIARKLGRIGREVTKAANELKSGIEREYDQATEPLKDVRRRLGSTIDDTRPTGTTDVSADEHAPKSDEGEG